MRTLTKMTKAEVINKVGQREYQDACAARDIMPSDRISVRT